MKEVKPPSKFLDFPHNSIFLAGSIEMGMAENWQSKVVKELEDFYGVIYNPRRDEWDNSWKQEKENPKFYEQVSWELNALEYSRQVFMYLAPDTKSPIPLLELGLVADKQKCIVCCPDGFWRKGNVEIVCTKYNIPFFDTYEAAMEELKSRLF